MINIYEVNETNNMIEHEKLDVQTVIWILSTKRSTKRSPLWQKIWFPPEKILKGILVFPL